MCVLVIALSHLVGCVRVSIIIPSLISVRLADLWIHATTNAILGANFTSPAQPQAMTLLFNETVCNDVTYPVPCLQGEDSWAAGEIGVRNAGFLLAANSSSALKLVTLKASDDASLVVPSVVDAASRFNATSFASRAKCTSLNPRCSSRMVDGMSVVESCANIGYPSLPYWKSEEGVAVTNAIYPFLNGTALTDGNSISVWPPSNIVNPFELLVQLRRPTQTTDASVSSFNSAVDSDDANSTLSLYASCTFSFLNVTYSYGDGAFNILSEVPTMPNTSNILWGPMINQLANARLASDLQATALSETNADNVITALEQDLSRIGLGMMGGVFIASSKFVQQETITSKTLGRYDAIPVFVLVDRKSVV